MSTETRDVNPFWDIQGLPVPAPLLIHLRAGDTPAADAWISHNREHPWMQPYMVNAWVLDSRFAVTLRPVTYFMRLPRLGAGKNQSPTQRRNDPTAAYTYDGDPGGAGSVVLQYLWRAWEGPEHPENEPPPEFPDLVQDAEFTVLDEQDWEEKVRDALRYAKDKKFRCLGPPKNPLYFTAIGLTFGDEISLHDHPDKDVMQDMARLKLPEGWY